MSTGLTSISKAQRFTKQFDTVLPDDIRLEWYGSDPVDNVLGKPVAVQTSIRNPMLVTNILIEVVGDIIGFCTSPQDPPSRYDAEKFIPYCLLF